MSEKIKTSRAKNLTELVAEYPKCFVLNPIVTDKKTFSWWDEKEMDEKYRHIEKGYAVYKDYKRSNDNNIFIPIDVWATGMIKDNLPIEYIDETRYVVHGRYINNNWKRLKGNLEVLDKVLTKFEGNIDDYVLIIPYDFVYSWISKIFESQPNLEFNYAQVKNIFKRSNINIVLWKQ